MTEPDAFGTKLEQELAAVLNRYSCENESNTPDFLLARFLLGCLRAWDESVRRRERWYGRDPNTGPGSPHTSLPGEPTTIRVESS